MPHTITVNQPNLPQGEEVTTEFGSAPNGGTLEVSDELVAIWQYNNPDRELPTVLDHAQAEADRAAGLEYLRRPADEGESEQSVQIRMDQATQIEADLERQHQMLDFSHTGPTRVAPQPQPQPLYAAPTVVTPEAETGRTQ